MSMFADGFNDHYEQWSQWAQDNLNKPGVLVLEYGLFDTVPTQYYRTDIDADAPMSCSVRVFIKDDDDQVLDADYFTTSPQVDIEADNAEAWRIGWFQAMANLPFCVGLMQSKHAEKQCEAIGFDIEKFLEETEGFLDSSTQIAYVEMKLKLHRMSADIAKAKELGGTNEIAEFVLNHVAEMLTYVETNFK